MIRLPDLREEDGFTLIELMVVVVILGVLLLMSIEHVRRSEAACA